MVHFKTSRFFEISDDLIGSDSIVVLISEFSFWEIPPTHLELNGTFLYDTEDPNTLAITAAQSVRKVMLGSNYESS